MKCLRNALVLMLSLMLMVGFSVSVFAADEAPASDFQYTVSSNGTVKIDKYVGTATEVVIPSVIEGKTVATIGVSAFEGNSNIKSVVIPETVVTILNGAFKWCTELNNIVLPDGLKSIYAESFYGCSSLNEVAVPQSVDFIGVMAFDQTKWIESVVDEQGFTIINNILVAYSGNATELVIPTGVTSIGFSVFWGNTSLVSVTIPEGVTMIRSDAFNGCSNLSSIIAPDTLETVYSNAFEGTKWVEQNVDEQGLVIAGSALIQCNDTVADVVIPSNVKCLAQRAFENCTNLKSLVIPNGVKSMTAAVLRGCTGLERIVMPDSITNIPKNTFSDCSKSLIIHGATGSIAESFAKDNNISFEAHTEVEIPGVEATCTKAGLTAGAECSVCNQITKKQEVIEAKGHTEVIIPAVAPTTEKEGSTEGKVCSVCEEVLVAVEKIPMLEKVELVIPKEEDKAVEEKTEIVVGNGAIVTEIKQPTEEVPKTVIKSNVSELISAVADVEDLAKVNSGDSLNIWLDVKDATETITEESKTVIEETTTEYTVGQYIDLSMFKKFESQTDEEASKVSNLANEITVEIELPAVLVKADRTYVVVRNHEGVVDFLDTAYNSESNTISFKTDKFSDYAIIYKDNEVVTSAPVEEPEEYVESTESTVVTTTSVNTGDTSPIHVLVVCMMLAIGTCVVTVRKKIN